MSLTFMSPALSMASKRPTRPQHLFEHNFIHSYLWYCWCWIVHPAITWFYKVLYIPRGAGSLRSIWYLYFKPLSLDNWMSLSTRGINLRLRVFETNLFFLKQTLFDRPCHPKEFTWQTNPSNRKFPHDWKIDWEDFWFHHENQLQTFIVLTSKRTGLPDCVMRSFHPPWFT